MNIGATIRNIYDVTPIDLEYVASGDLMFIRSNILVILVIRQPSLSKHCKSVSITKNNVMHIQCIVTIT